MCFETFTLPRITADCVFRHYYIRRENLDGQYFKCHAGWWAPQMPMAISQWYWLDWNIIQVIMIVRLHAMYQRSRKILIFLIAVFLAVQIPCVVLIVLMQNTGGHLLGRKLQLRIKYLSASDWWDEYQMSSSSLAPMLVVTTWMDTPNFWPTWPGYWVQYGRPLRCFSQSGLL